MNFPIPLQSRLRPGHAPTFVSCVPPRAWTLASTMLWLALAFLLLGSSARADLLVLQPGAISRGVFGEVARLKEESGTAARGFRPDNEGCQTMWLGADGKIYVASWLVGYGVVQRFTPAGEHLGKVADVAGVRFLAGATTRGGRMFLVAQIDAANGGTAREIWEADASDATVGPRRARGEIAEFEEPTALAVSAAGDLIVADARSGIVRIDAGSGARRATLATVPAGFGRVSAMALDADGALYLASATRGAILRLRVGAPAGAALEEWVSERSGMRGVEGLAFGGDGDLYASDSGTRAVRRFERATGAARGVIASFAAPARPAALAFAR